MGKRIVGIAVASLAVCLVSAVPARAGVVGLEMLLLVDVSGSIDAGEYTIQKDGYVAAFRDPHIQDLIANTPGGVVVAYAEWSRYDQQAVLVPWTLLTDAASAEGFADALSLTSRAFEMSSTATGDAILFGTSLFVPDNGYEGERLVIDISGDGEQNHAQPPADRFDPSYTFNAAAAAHAAGITVNGLAIGLGQGDLPAWYETYLTTPGGGILYEAASFSDFEDVVAIKIGEEIDPPGGGPVPVPEPATLGLLGMGVAGLTILNRRRGARRGTSRPRGHASSPRSTRQIRSSAPAAARE